MICALAFDTNFNASLNYLKNFILTGFEEILVMTDSYKLHQTVAETYGKIKRIHCAFITFVVSII